jgi:hypothetical protein
MRDWSWVGVVIIAILIIGTVALVVLATYGAVQEQRASRACKDLGYSSGSWYISTGVIYCHKMVDGTSVTVRLEHAEGGGR